MNVVSLLLVGFSSQARAVAVEASWIAFPVATVTDAATVGEALKIEPSGTELLLLFEPDPAALAQAASATDVQDLRRWTIVVFGPGPLPAGAAASLPPEDWKARLVAQVFQMAVRLHSVERENGRLRGDLSTLGRRINHDLRTPLNSISTACEAINEVMAEHTEDHTVFTQSITASAEELLQLIERVGLMLKASAEVNPKEPVVMGEIVFATLQRLERRILRQNASVAQPATWPVVRGVATWLETVWLNLVANALQHGGVSPQITLGWSEAEGQFRFWVDDNGPGVVREKNGTLFQPFHLLHRLNAPRGLGLPLVQRLVELQGGRCGYERSPAGGTRFFFTLPAVDVPENAQVDA